MGKSSTIAAVIFGASIGVALLKFYSMPKEERDAFFNLLKNKTDELLDNADDTVEKVEHFMNEIKSKGENNWLEKMYLMKKCSRTYTELRGIFFNNPSVKKESRLLKKACFFGHKL